MGLTQMRGFGLSLLAAVAAAAFAPAAGRDMAGQKPPRAKDYAVVINGETPQGPPLSLTFREDLKIAREGWTPWGLHVDGSGDIFVFADGERTLWKFDDHGAEKARLILKKGQGPGEFQLVDGGFLPDGRLMIYDGSQRRLTLFNGAFEIQDIRKVGFLGMAFRPDSRANMYMLDIRFLKGTRDRQQLVFVKRSPAEKILLEMADYPWGLTFDTAKKKYIAQLFPPQLKYAIDGRDFVYYAMSDRYEIEVLSPDGELRRTIVKSTPPRKMSKPDVDRKMDLYSESSKSMYEFVHPDRMPAISALFPLENDYLLAVTFESGPGSRSLIGDVFDEHGVFRGRARVPVFDGWDGLMVPALARAVCRGDSFYTIEMDETEENYFVKRYKMIWK
jgi:hypothetical protein